MGGVAILVPLFALAIPIVALIMAGQRKIAELRLEETRLRLRGGEADVVEELEDMREEMGHLRSEMGEFQERLDFAERLLTQPRGKSGLPPGGSND